MATRTAPAPLGGTADDQANLVAFFASAAAGDVLNFPAGAVYRHSDRLLLEGSGKSNITINATNVTFRATNPRYACLILINGANNITINGLRHEVLGATNRIDIANDVAPFVFMNVTGTVLNDTYSYGSAGLGYYFWNAQGGALNRITSELTKADGIHFTNGSGGFTATDCKSFDAGDDGFAHIGYLQDTGEAGRPHDIILVRPYVRDSRARGISYAGAKDCQALDVNIDGTLACNVYMAVERGDFNTHPTTNCHVIGGRLARAGTPYPAIVGGTDGQPQDQGAVLWLSSGTGAAVTNCSVRDVNVGALGSVNYDTFRAIEYGGTFAGCYTSGVKLYQGCPNTFVGGNIPSAISPATFTDLRTTNLPAYAGGSTPPPDPPPPTGAVTGQWLDRRGIAQIPGLVSLLVGTRSTPTTAGSAVTLVDDLGPNNYDLSNVNTGQRPTYITDSAPGWSFAGGGQQFLADAPSSLPAETLVVAARPTQVSSWQAIRGSQTPDAAGGYALLIIQGKLVWSRQGIADILTGAAAVPVNTTRIFTGTRSSSRARLFQNGTLDGTLANPITPPAGQVTRIGAGWNGQDNFLGQMYVVAQYNRDLADAELALVHSEIADYLGMDPTSVSGYVAAATGSGTAAASDAAAALDSAAARMDAKRASSDTSPAVDAAVARMDAKRASSDTSPAVDAAAYAITVVTPRTAADAAAATDTATYVMGYARRPTETAAAVDTASRITTMQRNPADSAHAVDSTTDPGQGAGGGGTGLARADITDYQFVIGEGPEAGGLWVPFGLGQTVVVERFDTGTADIRSQDVLSPVADVRWFGTDHRTPPTWSFDLYTDVETPHDALAWAEVMEEVWNAEAVRLTPNAVVPLRYRVAGRTRRVYGRPRNFTMIPDYVRTGRVSMVADFALAEHTYYDDDEQQITVRTVPSAVSGTGVTFPVTFPTTIGAPGDSPVVEQATVEGKRPTWVDVTFHGPSQDPWVDIAGLRWGLRGVVEAGFERRIRMSGKPWQQGIIRVTDGVALPGMLDPRARLSQLRLAPGTYPVRYGAYDLTGSSYATVAWRNANGTM